MLSYAEWKEESGAVWNALRVAAHHLPAWRSSMHAAITAFDHLTKEVEELRVEAERLTSERRKIVSHASSGATTGDGMSVNDVCVAISKSRNVVYVAGKESMVTQIDDLRAQLAARDAAIAAVADAMLQGGDGQTGDYGWNITKLNKARPLIRQIKQPEGEGMRYRHVKRGTVYTVIGEAELQVATGYLVEGAELTIYRGEDGKLWARERHEFHDGRFTPEQPEPDKLVEAMNEALGRACDYDETDASDLRTALAARGGRVVFDGEGK